MTTNVDPTMQNYFDDVDLGDEFEDAWTPTMDQVLGYLGLEGDALGSGGPGDGRFTDPEGAKKLGFPKPIVPGAFSLSKLTKLVTGLGRHRRQRRVRRRELPPPRPARRRPQGARPRHRHRGRRGLRHTVKLDIYLENERGERPLQGTAVVALPKR